MAAAQGINTLVKRVKQSALGVPGSTGSQYMRRVTATFNEANDTYASNEIVSHQQSTGATQGPGQVNGSLSGEISPGSYALEFAALLRKDFAVTSPITALSVTIAASGAAWTITRSPGWWTDGIKIGDVIRLSVGTLNAANIAKNLLIIGLTQTVATVVPLNGVALVAEGPVTGTTVTVTGKKSWVPTTGHSNDYFSWEKWYPDVPASELSVDVKVAKADVTIPASGIATVNFDLPGLSRTEGASEVLTSPTAASTTEVLAAVQGKVVVNGVVTNVTGAQFSIDGATTVGDPEVGSNSRSDLQRGKVSASGSFTAKFTSTVLQAIKTAQTPVVLILAIANNATATSDFITFVFPAVKIMTDDADDGEKIVVRSYSFTAQFNGSGGAALASHQTIASIQDSQA